MRRIGEIATEIVRDLEARVVLADGARASSNVIRLDDHRHTCLKHSGMSRIGSKS